MDYGSIVTLIKNDTREELVIKIEEDNEELSYMGFKLLQHKVGEKVTINNEIYFILTSS